MNYRAKEAAVPATIAIILAIGGMALLFGWFGCQVPDNSENIANRSRVINEAAAVEPEKVPDLISKATGGAVTTPEVDAGLKKTQEENPDLPWPSIIALYVGTLATRKVLPHVLGPALPFIAGLNPIIGLFASLVASTTETDRVKSGGGILWRKPTTLGVK